MGTPASGSGGAPAQHPLAYNALGLIVVAWQACDLVSAGPRAGLFVLMVPTIVVGMWVVYSIGVYISRSKPMVVRFAAGAVLGLTAVFSLVVVVVPDPAFADYSGIGRRADYPECGPRGIPTWWPSWLPS